MDTKKIQEQRMKDYFLSSAKDLIRAEGLAVVSARNVAERAGYSYATLYNYFNDIRDLIFSCIEDFMEECRVYVEEKSRGVTGGKKRIQAVSKSYVQFFVQYPGIFELIYLQKPGDISAPNANLGKIDTFFSSLTQSDWDICAGKKNKSKEPLAGVAEVHSCAIHGLLMFYLNRRNSMTYKELLEKVDGISAMIVPK